jgi:O-acetyl-ADP-ribose deacetylase (regulator of RNase III)
MRLKVSDLVSKRVRMNIHFVSYDEEFIEHVKDLFGERPHIQYTVGDIQTIPREGHAFVSPANSLGVMDGGIDLILSRKMFPGCEPKVKEMIAQIGQKSKLGRPYLRVGSALWFEVGSIEPKGPQTVLISAPTMFLPHDVSDTQNARLAMEAILVAGKKIEEATNGVIHTLVVTSLCCGVGRMEPEEAAIQIRAAFRRFETGEIPNEVEDIGIHYVMMPSYDENQPGNFDNREIGVQWPFTREFINRGSTGRLL